MSESGQEMAPVLPPKTTIMFFYRGEVAESHDEEAAAAAIADCFRLPAAETPTQRLDLVRAELVKGYAVRVSDRYYKCGLVGFRNRDSLDVRDDLRQEASAAFRRWARLLNPPHEMDFVSYQESQRLWAEHP